MSEALRDLEHTCSNLWSEPLFHLSLNSKELFHSNLLAWFIETYPNEAGLVFGRWVSRQGGVDGPRVQRVRAHLDLAVELPGLNPFVIENKVFSPPDEEQLGVYAPGSLAGLEALTLLLLSLNDPGWPGGSSRRWRPADCPRASASGWP